MSVNSKDDYLSLSAVAALLGLPEVTIQRWEHQGKIPYKIIRKKIVFKKKEIIEWAQAHDLPLREEIRDSKALSTFSLTDIIKDSGIYYHIPGEDVYTIFESALKELNFINSADKNTILEELINREELASTGIGNGIAIPHTRNRLDLGLKRPFIPVFFLENAVPFNAIDGQAVYVLFMIFSNTVKDHLKILSMLSFALRQENVISSLQSLNKNHDLLEHIKQIEHETR